jgi:hypothetical protein
MSKVQRTRPGTTSSLAHTPLAPAVEAPVIGLRPGDSQTHRLTDSVSAEVPESVSTPSREGARYLRLLRKEARLRVDQANDLAALRRRLARRRAGPSGEILTDNTLIRVAVDLLLHRADELHGETEEELRASLGLSHIPR